MMIENLYKKFLECNGLVCTDTRKITKGSIFFALKGDNFNGNDFALQAIEQGAAYAVVDEMKAENARLILVKNVLTALQNLATHHRKQFEIPVLAITGSNGKTTTKELVARVLSKKYKTHFTQGNLNNHIGVPLTLLAMDKSIEMAVIEMGANHQGEISELCSIALPTHGLITNVGKAHLEGFGGFEGVIKGKTELYDFLKQHDGLIFCNSDNQFLAPHCTPYNKVIYYGSEGEYIKGEIINEKPFLQISWAFSNEKIEFKLNTNLTGSYNFENILAAVAVGSYFNVRPLFINEAIDSYVPSNQRSQIVKTNTNTIIADYYNANPTSMEKAIINFDQNFSGNKCVMLGDMFELGVDEDSEHSAVIELVKKHKIKMPVFVGERFSKHQYSIDALFFKNSKDACDYFKQNPLLNYNVLIKGSRSSKMELLMDVL